MDKFTQLCQFINVDGKVKITGPMSPMLGIKEYAKQLDIPKPFNAGIVRIKNEQSTDATYDHLAIMPYKNAISLIVDMGVFGLPVCIYFIDDKSITITSIYKKSITDEEMEKHRESMECPKRCQDNPIMRLSEKQLKDLMQELIDSNVFLNKDDYAKATIKNSTKP